jgi:hypothetical protein
MGAAGNVILDCLDKTTGKATGSTGSYNTSGRASDHHMHFSHSNLIDVCRVDGWFTAHYRPHGSTPKHNLTSAHTVYWNTEGIASPTGKVVHSRGLTPAWITMIFIEAAPPIFLKLHKLQLRLS